jgi:hypothetical protein
MTRQLKISEDVHTMLWLLKPNDSTSYDWVISMLIENAVPSLPYRLERINRLEKDNPEEWASEMHDLQQDILENFTVDFLSSQKERDEQVASEMAEWLEEDAIEQHERELEEQLEKHLEETSSVEVVSIGSPIKNKKGTKRESRGEKITQKFSGITD